MRNLLARAFAIAAAGALVVTADSVEPRTAPGTHTDEISTGRPISPKLPIRSRLLQFNGRGVLLSRDALLSGPARDVAGPFALLRMGLNGFSELRL